MKLGATGQPVEDSAGPKAKGIAAPPPFEGTAQQNDFWRACLDDSLDVQVIARAGSGKTTSSIQAMRMMLEQDGSQQIRYGVFNKSNADEMEAKTPNKSINFGTFHSFGFRDLRAMNNRVFLDSNKPKMIWDQLKNEKPTPLWEWRSSAQRLATRLKEFPVMAQEPGGLNDENLDFAIELADLAEIPLGQHPDEIADLAYRMLWKSQELFYSHNVIDFDDMVYLPWMTGCKAGFVDSFFIDEAQDLNGVQLAMVERYRRDGARVISIGDDRQSIYGWRGADPKAMEKIRTSTTLRKGLTITFRCPWSHVQEANLIVPDLEAAPNAKDGEVIEEEGDYDRFVEDLKPGDMVICRTNAPLVKVFRRCLAKRIPAIIRGKDCSAALLELHDKIAGMMPMNLVAYRMFLNTWETERLKELRSREAADSAIESIVDKAAAIREISESCSSIPEVETVIRSFQSAIGHKSQIVTLSTIHKAKGDEAERIHFLDVPDPTDYARSKPRPPWVGIQLVNLRYVALTRSKDYMRIFRLIKV